MSLLPPSSFYSDTQCAHAYAYAVVHVMSVHMRESERGAGRLDVANSFITVNKMRDDRMHGQYERARTSYNVITHSLRSEVFVYYSR